MKTIAATIILFFGFSIFAQTPPRPVATTSVSDEWTVKTESGVTTPEFSDCPSCARLQGDHPPAINFGRLNSQYSFNALPKDEQAKLLRELGPGAFETPAEREARLKGKVPIFATSEGGAIERVRNLGRFGKSSKIKLKLGKNPGIKYEVKF